MKKQRICKKCNQRKMHGQCKCTIDKFWSRVRCAYCKKIIPKKMIPKEYFEKLETQMIWHESCRLEGLKKLDMIIAGKKIPNKRV